MEGDFDYVVVGAGSAGCVIANRLAAAGNRVALLEAGGDTDSLIIRNPALSILKAIGSQRYDWRLLAEPDPTRNGIRSSINRGKGLGGSSAINGMIYLRGHPGDYDSWGQACPGWSWSDLEPCFVAMERAVVRNREARGTCGPLPVEPIRNRHPLAQAFLESAAKIGLPRRESLNELETEGAAFTEATQHMGRRVSAAEAYVYPALRRGATMTVVTHAQATRILLKNGRACAVEYRRGGNLETITARREVIVSAGAVHSPHLLMHSGIGPAQHLKHHGIAPVADLPGVGLNLQDHAELPLARTVSARTLNQELGPLWQAWHGLRWLATGGGPAANPGTDAVAFARTREDLATPDVLVYFGPYIAGLYEMGVKASSAAGITLDAQLCRPRSRGKLTLKSPDPFEAPAIGLRLLDDPEDIATLLRGFRLLERLCAAEPLAGFITGCFPPGRQPQTDPDVIDYMREATRPSLHVAGTCRMGEDRLAVVDPKLRVHGVAGLRVADASVLPQLFGGNLNATALVIGERAAQLILGDSR